MHRPKCIHAFGVNDESPLNHQIRNQMTKKMPFIGGLIFGLLFEENSSFCEFNTQCPFIKFFIKTGTHFLMHGDGCRYHLSGQFLIWQIHAIFSVNSFSSVPPW